MKFSINKLSGSAVGLYVNMTPKDKPILVHRVTFQWFDKAGNAFAGNSFRPDQFIEENISILIASMPIVPGAAQVKASVNYETIDGTAETTKLKV